MATPKEKPELLTADELLRLHSARCSRRTHKRRVGTEVRNPSEVRHGVEGRTTKLGTFVTANAWAFLRRHSEGVQ